MFKVIATAVVGLALMQAPAHADDTIKIGFIASLSGSQATLGRDLLDGFQLGVDSLGGKLGGVPAEVLARDDQGKPDVGAQAAQKLVERDRVPIVTGINLSNVLLAAVPKVLDADRIYLSINAGPSELAGKGCSPHFFNVAHQNDTVPEAMGLHLNQIGVKNLYIMAPNFAAGKDMVAGLKRTYKGQVAAEIYTQFGQLDYSAELAKLRSVKPDALFVFYPGGMGVNFFKQLAQAGLKGEIPVYTVFSTDQDTLPGIGDAALGIESTAYWSEQLDNPLNKKFVADFEKTYKRIPSPRAAMGYDGARLIDAALKQNGGKFVSADSFAKALRTVDFKSIRGDFKFNTNNFPIQDHYLLKVEKDAQGRLVNTVVKTITTAYADAYAGQCKMAHAKP
ncbi:ABC transporter substrate-binding protein [Eoetvoesiella caeni]|uniref:Branched-chain amino acid transport system substrate-binding protein n=1 Tax=Eoetvoesiella caeni TaxID=645616 RepID=A0A366HHB7_9BURK|nr:ABC transporter substrate-binding protein [Eoetvoesiella caeni]MCI2808096.1 ABC transporter substrate-binding protein [Eoetvoesiella caeni]NYT53902.1 ABC transporter substrate-binding protein [Eoetvoesiella caeni]RBP42018.1 branched-chain amino acid transport system substrate-binding protein [Eoetvoesiella caeni]